MVSFAAGPASSQPEAIFSPERRGSIILILDGNSKLAAHACKKYPICNWSRPNQILCTDQITVSAPYFTPKVYNIWHNTKTYEITSAMNSSFLVFIYYLHLIYAYTYFNLTKLLYILP